MSALRHVLVALVVTTLVVPATVLGPTTAPADAAAPPETLCSVCSADFDAIAEDHDVDLATGGSALTIDVDEDGSSQWTARIEITDGADELRGDETLQRALVETPDERHVVDERRNLTTRVEDSAFVLSYEGPTVGYRSAGTFVFDLLTREPNRAGVYGGADRVVLLAPSNHTVATTPPAATEANESAVVWGGDDGDDGVAVRSDGSDTGASVEQSYVTFAPEGTWLGGMQGQAAVALAVGPAYVVGLATAAALPVVALLASGAILSRRRRRGGTRRDRRRPALAGFGLAVVGVGVGAAVLARGTVPDAPVLALALVVPTVVFFALGYATGTREHRSLLATLAVLPVAAAFALGLTGPWALLLFVPLTVGTLTLGVPAFYVGLSVER